MVEGIDPSRWGGLRSAAEVDVTVSVRTKRQLGVVDAEIYKRSAVVRARFVFRVLRQLGRIRCRKFPAFVLTVSCVWTLLLRPGKVAQASSEVRHAVRISDRTPGFVSYRQLRPTEGSIAEVLMALAVVRSLDAPRRLGRTQELEDFEQELVDQYLLAAVGAGLGDSVVGNDRAVLFEFMRFLGRPIWTAEPHDADRFLTHQRKNLGRARTTVQQKAWAIGHFFEFLLARYQGDIHTLTGCVVGQPIDEYNRPAKADYGQPRIHPRMRKSSTCSLRGGIRWNTNESF